jgi:phage tail-like protein
MGMTMHSVSSGTQIADPYRSFSFRVKWNGKYVAAVSRASALRRTADTIFAGDTACYDDARDTDRTEYEPISLQRGVTHDVEFETWARQVKTFRAERGALICPATFRRDITLEFYNDSGQLVYAYNLIRCWPSEYVASPELDASPNAVGIETLVLQNEGWARDEGVIPPDEPSFFG